MENFTSLFSNSLKEYQNKFLPILKTFTFLYLIPIIIIGILGLIIFNTTMSDINISEADIATLTSKNTSPEIILPTLNNIIEQIPTQLMTTIIILFLAFILIYIAFNILATLTFIQIAFKKEKNIKFGKAFREGKKYFWKLIGLILLIILILIPLYILLIIPGIIFSIFFIFSIYILIDKKTKITEALKQSYNMVKGRWWKTFGYVILILLLSTIATGILNKIPLIGGLLPTLLITPISIIFFKNLYLDMKKK